MKEKIKTQKGFIQIPLLVIIIASIVAALAIIGVVLYKQGKLAPSVAKISGVFKETKEVAITEEIELEESQTERLETNQEEIAQQELEQARLEAEKAKTEAEKIRQETERAKAEAERLKIEAEEERQREIARQQELERQKQLTYLELNKPYISKTGITITVTNIEKVEEVGSYKYIISYKQENKTTDKELDEGTFKMFFEDGTGLNQYGFFDKLFPNENITRTYTFQILKTQKPFCIEFNDDIDVGLEGAFFRNQPATDTLKWKIE